MINKRSDLKIIYYDGPGICKADNVYKGFDLASGDIFVILADADNTVDPKEIKKIIKVLVKKSKFVIGTRLVCQWRRMQ